MAAALPLALLLGGCSFPDVHDLPLPGNEVTVEEGFQISADFEDVLNVVPRSTVRLGDIPIGQVESVTRTGWNARVTMRIRKDVELPADTEAEIRQSSLLGEKYVELSAPQTSDTDDEPTSSGRLADQDVIPIDRTGRNPEVEEVLGALSLLLTGGGVGQLQTISHELNEMMEGRTGEVRNVLRNVNTLVSTLNTQRGDIVDALESVNGLSETLVAEKETITEALDEIAPAVTELRDQQEQLVTMLSELDELGVVATRVVGEIKEDLLADLRHLEPILRNLADTGDSLVPGAVAAASYPFPINAADTIKGDYANVIFRLQVKLTPVDEGGLLPTTLDDLTTLCRATPLAPICSPVGDAIDDLCSLLAALPLCDQRAVDDVSALLGNLRGEDHSDPSGGSPGGGAPSAHDSALQGSGGEGASGAEAGGDADASLVEDILRRLAGGG